MKQIALSLAVVAGFAGLQFCYGEEEDKKPRDGAGDAGVRLYQFSQCLEQMSRSKADLTSNAKSIEVMTQELIKDDTIRGFGSMGGEEFFSYLNTSDSLHRITALRADAGKTSMQRNWSVEPLSEKVEKGLKWLVSVQGTDGGWGQDGGEVAYVRQSEKLESKGNDIANTAVSALAFLRAGHTATRGAYKENVKKAIEFVLAHVEESKDEGLGLATPPNTQIQRKLGTYIDTFMASMLLAEVDGNMSDEKSNSRVRKALNKVIAKIEKNQSKDGSWNTVDGWAPILGTSYCSRSLDVAQKKGVAVNEVTLNRVNDWTLSNANAAMSGKTARGEGASFTSAKIAVAAAPVVTVSTLPVVSETPVTSAATNKAVGEDAWEKWNTKIKTHIDKLQNQDGTWSGQHCITGRVACTGAAVLTLLAERAPVAVNAAEPQKK